ncbi:MAG: MCE family protein, partial [Actinomycetota bacterium]|nr:MCE family protein [Actinomycetota bacterium]
VTVLMAALLSGCGAGTMSLTAYFSDSGDLQSRGSVQVADVRVGTVGRVTLTKDFRAKVQLHVRSNLRIPKNSTALLRTTSLLGEKFVELRPIGDPNHGPFLTNGDTVAHSDEAPELEFVAQTAVELLAGVNANSVASIVQTGAQAFGGRGAQLGGLISDLNQLSATLASRTTQIGQVIDNLDRATRTLAAGSNDLSNLLVNLAQTTTLLANDREKVVTALASLTHLAEAADYSLNKYQSAIDREIKQVDAVTGTLVNALGDVSTLVDWLQRFAIDFPVGIQGNFGNVFLRVVPYIFDPRSPK